MLQVMNNITDHVDWHLDICDSQKVHAWRLQALQDSLMSERAWDWCLAELMDKAAELKRTGRVVVLNAREGICKSDTAITVQTQAELRNGVADLLATSKKGEDGRYATEAFLRNTGPNATNLNTIDRRRAALLRLGRGERGRTRAGIRGRVGRVLTERVKERHIDGMACRSQVVNHIDPALFPLVYGTTRFLGDSDSPSLSLSGCLDHSGDGSIAVMSDADPQLPLLAHSINETESSYKIPPPWTYREEDFCFISRRFQRLPCEVSFTNPNSEQVEIASYVNNLHPTRSKSMYKTLEKVIEAAIQPWNEVLVKDGSYRYVKFIVLIVLPASHVRFEEADITSRWTGRILTRGFEWSTNYDDNWPSDEALLELEKDRTSESFKLMVYRIREYILQPENNMLQRNPFSPFRPRSPLDSDD